MVGVAVIYRIRHIETNKCYIGHTVRWVQRKEAHTWRLKNKVHHSNYLQNAWNKYGEDAFVFEILEECPIPDRLAREQWWIDNTNSEAQGLVKSRLVEFDEQSSALKFTWVNPGERSSSGSEPDVNE